MKKIYVAHPYNAEERNKKSVESIIKDLVEKDPTTLYISPIHSTGYFYKNVSYEQGMEYCYELLQYCNELLLCEGWENSRGCNLEKQYAEEHGIPIRYHMKARHEDEDKEELRVTTSFGDLVVTKGYGKFPIHIHLDRDGDIYNILHIEETVNASGEMDLKSICYIENQSPIMRTIHHEIPERMKDEVIHSIYQEFLRQTNDMVISDRYSVEAINEFALRNNLNDSQLQKILISQNSKNLSSKIINEIH